MDSLTQIVLGAACGEVALGKKIGNKALLFGAIGGTIPDMDVFLAKLFYINEIDRMAFHRGFMHSIVFAILAAFILGAFVYWLYNRGKRLGTTNRKNWIWLFFLSIFTHPILDSFTPYGTQLFLPFSDYRVALNAISVVDPIYTLPFLLCFIAVMFYKRNSNKRLFLARLGLTVSTFYMLLTILNKWYVNSVFKDSLIDDGIAFSRFQTQPTFFNNVLWYGIAETETSYYVGYYSILDRASRVENWKQLPKNHELVSEGNKDIQTLSWFSNGYYNLIPLEENTFRYNDLRYPYFNMEDPNSSIFSFSVKKEGERLNGLPFYGKPPSSEDLSVFWKRLKGND
ncbi:metal-dependent hydrolase [Formosa maritima]|uniref:Metal-dependent hydrolase n=1 Tax=Formosa maritima TaxID=2592046 RepID=A0A5D0GK31_9FLAO|nr:metal-dependent hydrolase [Formosa maritima]TYA59303.1 metal-dependent hydrolase [Formosa maritima]